MKPASDLLSSLWKRIPHAAKCAFFAALVVGIVAHLPFSTHYFVNNDSISTVLHSWEAASLSQGKYLQEYAIRTGGPTISPNVSVTLSILMIAITAAITVTVLRVKRSVYAALVGVFLVLTPSVCCSFSYQISIGYFMPLLFAAVSVGLATQKKWYTIALSILFLTLSLGIYQAYIGYAAGLFILLCLVKTLEGREDNRHILLEGLRYLCILLASVACYYIILRIWLSVENVPLSPYRGIDAIGSLRTLDLSQIGRIAWEAVKKVYYFFISDAYGTGFIAIKWTYRIVVLLAAIWSVLLAVKGGLYRKPGALALAAVCVILFPFAIHAIAILGLSAETSWLMTYSFVLVFVYLAKVADMAEDAVFTGTERVAKWMRKAAATFSILVCAVSLALSYQWFLITNQCYEKLRNAYEHVYAASVELNTDINHYPGFDQKTVSVGFVGDDFPDLFACRSEMFDYLNGYGVGASGIHNSELIDRVSRIYAYMEHFLGVDFDIYWYGDPYVDVEWSNFYDEEELRQLREMPIYPREGSMRMMDGVLIVKMSEFYAE